MILTLESPSIAQGGFKTKGTSIVSEILAPILEHVTWNPSSVLLFSVVSTPKKRFELGTRVPITGTNQVSNSSGVTNPSFLCLVDGESTSVVTLSAPENKLLFCEKDGLSVGSHQISVEVSVLN